MIEEMIEKMLINHYDCTAKACQLCDYTEEDSCNIGFKLKPEIITTVKQIISEKEKVDKIVTQTEFEVGKQRDKIIDGLLKRNEKLKEFIADLTVTCERETEYDGKMLMYCFFCGAYLDEKDHNKDCDYLKALSIVGDIIQKRQNEQEKIDKQNAPYVPPKNICSGCGKKYHQKFALFQHQRDKHDIIDESLLEGIADPSKHIEGKGE